MGSFNALTRRFLYRGVASAFSYWERAGVRKAMPVCVPGWLLALCLLGCLGTIPVISSAETWQDKTSTHFRVFYQQDPAFAAAVLDYAEAYYRQIRLDLGLTHVVQRDQVPWLWDKRCQIYLYPNRQAYRQATGAPAWSSGFVNYPRRMVYSHLEVASFLEQTLPHELAHIIFREFGDCSEGTGLPPEDV